MTVDSRCRWLLKWIGIGMSAQSTSGASVNFLCFLTTSGFCYELELPTVLQSWNALLLPLFRSFAVLLKPQSDNIFLGVSLIVHNRSYFWVAMHFLALILPLIDKRWHECHCGMHTVGRPSVLQYPSDFCRCFLSTHCPSTQDTWYFFSNMWYLLVWSVQLFVHKDQMSNMITSTHESGKQ